MGSQAPGEGQSKIVEIPVGVREEKRFQTDPDSRLAWHVLMPVCDRICRVHAVRPNLGLLVLKPSLKHEYIPQIVLPVGLTGKVFSPLRLDRSGIEESLAL